MTEKPKLSDRDFEGLVNQAVEDVHSAFIRATGQRLNSLDLGHLDDMLNDFFDKLTEEL